MNCKNCERPLRTDYSFCSNCGAKIIRNRLTLKNLWYDVTERYFNIDNSFLRTYFHLFTKPEVVIGGYISGVRKKYLNPVSYIAIALTLSGILLFFIKRAFPEGIDFDLLGTGVYDAAASKRLTDFMLTFYSVLYLVMIPILAVSGWFVFNERKVNFTEYIVLFIYTQAQFSLLSLPFTLAVIWYVPGFYTSFSFISIAVLLIYNLYVLKRFTGLKGGDFVLKAFIFLIFFGFGYLFNSFLNFILMLLSGAIDLNTFAPKP